MPRSTDDIRDSNPDVIDINHGVRGPHQIIIPDVSSDGDVRSHVPLLSTMAALSDHGVESLLSMHQLWLQDAGALSVAHGHWLYALLAALDRLLDADTTGVVDKKILSNESSFYHTPY